MLIFILRRLAQAVLTIFGVMLLTFLLFRVIAGDVAAANLGEKANQRQKAAWRHRYGYDKPRFLNLHRRLTIVDKAGGEGAFNAMDVNLSTLAEALALFIEAPPAEEDPNAKGEHRPQLMGRYVWFLGRDTPIEELTEGAALIDPNWAVPGATTKPASGTRPPSTRPAAHSARSQPATQPAPSQPASKPTSAAKPTGPHMALTLSDGAVLHIAVQDLRTCGDLMDRINNHPDNRGRVEATISSRTWYEVFDSQFFHHLKDSATFQTRSLKGEKKKMTQIIADRAPASLSITVPAMVIQFMVGMAISCFVAYYRGTLIDKIGVFLCVLGMCVPFLAFMIYGQWAMFEIAPRHAYGTFFRGNVYLPISIMVVAGLGGMVRFYRTIILDETGRDYVRTAKAKGVTLPGILFKHVLRNCMLPILTSVILAIPFLIMGSLLVESYFGIPGLGDLMITSINDRNEPIMNGMVFLTALIYTVGLLLTDISYAIFDPRIRLR